MFVTDLGFSNDVLEFLLQAEIEELDHLTKNACTWAEPADSARYRKERALHGYSISDIWNLDSYLTWIMASLCRKIASPSSRKLLDLLINLRECGEQNLYPMGYNKLNQEVQEAWKKLSKYNTDEAEILFPSLYKAAFNQTPNHALSEEQVGDVLKLIRTFKGTIINLKHSASQDATTKDVVIWDDVKYRIPSPILVPDRFKQLHDEERSKQGYSRYDVENPRLYLAWVIVQCGLFFASDKAAGVPARFKTFADWQIELLNFLEGIWLDAFTENSKNYLATKAFNNFVKILPDLWD